jgi:hypothetical protein
MSEIKFACPHCAQHIACDSNYADMCIVCPGCGKPMVVPILSATNAAHPDLCLVAATPAPRQKFQSHVPMLDPWTEEDWAEHYRNVTGESPRQTPRWVVAVLLALLSPFIGLGILFVGCSACS